MPRGFIAGDETYLRKDLRVTLSLEYRAIVFRSINARWVYGLRPGVLNAIDYTSDIAAAMRRNPAMQLFIGIGYYDLVTPLGAAEYTILHSGIEPARVGYHYYASGHVMYMGRDNRRKTAEDLRRFIGGSAS
jgi:hypothetical protein